MQLVIDMSEEIYLRLKDDVIGMDDGGIIVNCIKNGKPLPKGHGRLIDADSFLAKYEVCGYVEDMEVDYFNEVTPTIIEADKEDNRR